MAQQTGNSTSHRAAYDMEDVLTTSDLAQRPARTPDYAAENHTFVTLAQELSANPDNGLQKVAALAMQSCKADSAGISILEPGETDGIFRWHAAVGDFAPHLHGTMPRDVSPCALVVARNEILLFNKPERLFPALCSVQPPIYQGLLAPWECNGKVVGTLWVIAHTPERRFEAEGARLLQNLSRFAAARHLQLH